MREYFIEWFLFPFCLFLILKSYVQHELGECVVAAPETRSHVSEVVWVLLEGDRFMYLFTDMEDAGF